MKWFEKIHQHAVHCSRQFKKAEYEMILALQKVDSKKVFRKMGYGSLFEYAVKALILPEGTAYGFINVARKSVKMPEITKALSSGTATVAQFKHVLSVMTPENQLEWTQKVDPNQKGKVKLERLVEILFEEKIQRAKEIVSQKTRKVASLEEVLNTAIEFYIEKNDPVRIAASQEERRTKRKIHGNAQPIQKQPSVASPVQPAPGKAIRQSLPQKIVQAIYLRDQATCQYQNCKSRTFLDIHHILPVSKGGSNAMDNLKLLCRSHHQLHHEEMHFCGATHGNDRPR